MKQLLQDARSGELNVAEVPPPQLLPGCVLVRVAASLVSAGTERAAAEFAAKTLAGKAKDRPDLVRDVLAKVRRDGLLSAWQAVRSRLDQPQSVGYSSAGVVLEAGEGVTDVSVGDRVACAGAGYAVHAELACVPRLLMAKIPAGSEVSFEEAAFGTIGAVCLHGMRTAGVSVGDAVAVIGLGLLGQVTVQLLRAAGCRVLGIDPVDWRAELAKAVGAEKVCTSRDEFRDACQQNTGGRGVDAVLITAETPSSDPVNLAAEIARDRAVVTAVGSVGMEIQRRLYYEKELDFRISRSYGPGRYDSAYEQKGRDYPIGHVRWTETRNLEAFLQLAAERKLDLQKLITHRFPIDEARRAYDLITGRSGERFLGVMLNYPEAIAGTAYQSSVTLPVVNAAATTASVGIGVLGAGNFAQAILLPAVQSIPGVSMVGVCNATGPRGKAAAEKFRFQYCTAAEEQILNDPKINAVVIATRHHLHAGQVLAALRAGKAVFCEKPLCLTEAELADIAGAYSVSPGNAPAIMVGFNRRFAPMAVVLKRFVSEIREPLAIHYRVNAGFLPPDHWTNDPEQGGGRILGEVCHFVDFVGFLAGTAPVEVECRAVGNEGRYSGENVVAALRFADGGLATITYLANGDRAGSKERIEVFGGGSTAILDDFRTLELVRHGRRNMMRSRWKQDKGHGAEMQAFVAAVQGKAAPPIPFEQILGSTLATLRLQRAGLSGKAQTVDVREFLAAARHSQADPDAML